MRVSWIDRDNYVRLKSDEELAKMISQSEEDAEFGGEIFLAIQPAIDLAPNVGSAIDHAEVEDPGPVVQNAITFGEKVVQVDLGAVRRDFAETIAKAAGGAVMSFAKAGGEDEDSFQSSLGQKVAAQVGQSLMDISLRQSKLSP